MNTQVQEKINEISAALRDSLTKPIGEYDVTPEFLEIIKAGYTKSLADVAPEQNFNVSVVQDLLFKHQLTVTITPPPTCTWSFIV